MRIPPGYRKMILAVLFTAIGLVVEVHTKNGLSLTLVQFLLGVYGTFAAGNMFEHYCQKAVVSGHVQTNPVALPMIDPSLHEKTDHLLQTAQITQQALGFVVDYIKSFQARSNPTQPPQV